MCNDQNWKITLKFCKADVIVSVAFIVLCVADVVPTLLVAFFLPSYKYHLPMNCYIFFLNVEGNILNWVINYILQCYILIFGATFLVCHFLLILILMNQSSWIAEAAIFKVNKIDEKISEGNLKLKEFLNEIAQEISDVIEWQNVIRIFLRMFFLADLTILATVLCMYFYSIMLSSSMSFQSLAFLSTELVLFFQLCLMGSKFNTKLSMLSAAIYAQNWHLLSVHHQKVLKLILQISQNIQGVDGVFKTVDLATFQQV